MLMLSKTDFFTAFDFCKADRSVGFGWIWSQVTLLHHQQNCLLSWLYMNNLFTSNSPKVMHLHQAQVWSSDVSQMSLLFIRRQKSRESESTEKVNINSLKTSMENVIVFYHRYCAMRNVIGVLKVLSPDHRTAHWRKSAKSAVWFGYHHQETVMKSLSQKKRKKSKPE